MALTKIIWSLDTRPALSNRWGQGDKLRETILLQAMSCLYTSLWYTDLELYTDELGYSLLSWLPVKVYQMDFKSSKDLWMDSKMQVIKEQRRPFIHIDGDVFLQKPIPQFHKYSGVIIERAETGKDFEGHYREQIGFLDGYFKGILRHWDKEMGYSFNCGTLGFTDMSLKDDYIKEYDLATSLFSSIKEEYTSFNSIGFEPCIVLEQYNLATFLHYRGISPIRLLEDLSIETNMDFASRMGYCHLYGVNKYLQIKEVEQRMKDCFPHWHDVLMKKFRDNSLPCNLTLIEV